MGFGLAAGLVLVELALRLAGYSFVAPFQPDERLGQVFRPGLAGWWRGEQDAPLTTNQLGQRDVERSLEKPPAARRVALLGDSFVAGLEVRLEDTVGAALERELKGCWEADGRTVEVLNFGVTAYGTAQELLTLRERVAAYRPDLVVLAFFAGNDVRDNYRPLSRSNLRPYLVERDGQLVEDLSFRESADYRLRTSWPGLAAGWLRQHVRGVQLLAELRQELPSALRARRGAEPDGPGPGGAPPGPVDAVLAPPRSEAWQRAWQVTERLLVATRDESARLGADFVLALVPLPGQAHPSPDWRERYRAALGADSLFYPERRLADLGAAHGFEAIALAPAMQALAEREQTHLYGFGAAQGQGHWNERGHQVAAELIAARLCARAPS